MKKFSNVAGTLIIVLLVFVLAAVMVPKLFFGVEMKAVLTSSMEPERPVGSLVIVVPAEYTDIAVGDDITFVRDKNLTLVTHRVISKNDEDRQLITQGVANNTADKPVNYENVLGKVKFHIPYVGYLAIWTGEPKGKIIAVTVIVALVALSLVLGSGKTKSKEKERPGGSLTPDVRPDSEQDMDEQLEALFAEMEFIVNS